MEFSPPQFVSFIIQYKGLIKLHFFLSYHNNTSWFFCVWFTYNPAGFRPLKIRFTSHRQSMFFHETNCFCSVRQYTCNFLSSALVSSEGDDCLCDWWKSHIRFIWYILGNTKVCQWNVRWKMCGHVYISSKGGLCSVLHNLRISMRVSRVGGFGEERNENVSIISYSLFFFGLKYVDWYLIFLIANKVESFIDLFIILFKRLHNITIIIVHQWNIPFPYTAAFVCPLCHVLCVSVSLISFKYFFFLMIYLHYVNMKEFFAMIKWFFFPHKVFFPYLLRGPSSLLNILATKKLFSYSQFDNIELCKFFLFWLFDL